VTSHVIYITHPEVVIDPHIQVPQWTLSAVGAERMRLFSRDPALGGARSVWCSTQTKAQVSARILSEALNLPVLELQELGENDRSSTGYVAPPRFWELVNAFFSSPEESAEGWETARHAQDRTMKAIDHVIANSPDGDILIVGHGGVGRLALASLKDEPIDLSSEQPGQGSWFWFDRETRVLRSSWQPLPRDSYASAQNFSFGDSPTMADELLALVIAGTKTATCGATIRRAARACRSLAAAMWCWTAGATAQLSSKRSKSPSAASMKWTRPLPTTRAKVSAHWLTGAKAIRPISNAMAASRLIWNWCASGSVWWKR
jgi:broad specificity phosphatase PhoE